MMNQGTRLFGYIFVICALFLGACSPSAEGETETWTRNQGLVSQYAGVYSGFKTVLEADQKKAQSMWAEAEGVEDEKTRAAKMEETNKYQAGLLQKFEEIKSKTDSIDTTLGKLNKLKLSGAKKSKRASVVKEVQAASDAVSIEMNAAAPKDRAEAQGILEKQASAITAAWSKANSTLSSLKKGKKKSKKKSKKK
jgi:hypothetical protein